MQGVWSNRPELFLEISQNLQENTFFYKAPSIAALEVMHIPLCVDRITILRNETCTKIMVKKINLTLCEIKWHDIWKNYDYTKKAVRMFKQTFSIMYLDTTTFERQNCMANFLLNIKIIASLIYNSKRRVLFCLFHLHDQIYIKWPNQNRVKVTPGCHCSYACTLCTS